MVVFMKISGTRQFILDTFSHSIYYSKKILKRVTDLALLALSTFVKVLHSINPFCRNIKQHTPDPKSNKATKPVVGDPQKDTLPKVQQVSTQISIPKDSSRVLDIRKCQAAKLKEFEHWAANQKWKEIRSDHYDWWMFPVERPSTAYKERFAVNANDVAALKNDPEFMKRYRRGVAIVIQAWGWDLENERPIPVSPHQPNKPQWDGYGVRLAKMSDSLLLFGENDLHMKLRKFFKEHCLPQQNQVEISNLPWLMKTLKI